MLDRKSEHLVYEFVFENLDDEVKAAIAEAEYQLHFGNNGQMRPYVHNLAIINNWIADDLYGVFYSPEFGDITDQPPQEDEEYYYYIPRDEVAKIVLGDLVEKGGLYV